MFALGGFPPLRAHVEQVHEEVVGQRLGPLGEYADFRLPGVGVQNAHTADQHGHLGRGQRQQLRAIHQQLLRRPPVLAREVIAEAVCGRFEGGERVHVGLLLRRVRAPRREGNLDVVPGVLGRLLDGGASAENDHVGERDLLPAGLRAVELRLDLLQGLQDLRQFGRVVHGPILLRCEANARPVGAAALVRAAEG